MKRSIEIRQMRIDDLRQVFLMGRDHYHVHAPGPARPWNEKNMSDVVADHLDSSFVAWYKKDLMGLLIGAVDSQHATAKIIWMAAREFGGVNILGELYAAFLQSIQNRNIDKIQIEVVKSDNELIDFCNKFGFTESKDTLIMENFLLKGKH
jgi:hypothetical protein